MLQEVIKFFPTQLNLTAYDSYNLKRGYCYRHKIKVMYNDFLLMTKIRTDNMKFYGFCGKESQVQELFLLGFGTSLPNIKKGKADKWTEIEVMFIFVKK